MPRLRFTEKNVAKLAAPDPSGEQVIYWDEALPGFGLLVSGASSAKTWVAKATINGRGVRRKIGRADVTPLVDARAAAKKMMANFAVGIDPRQKKLRRRHPADGARRLRGERKTQAAHQGELSRRG